MSAKSRRLLVTGGTGLVGSRLVAALVAGGDDVVVTSRQPRTIPGATTVRWDPATDPLEPAVYAGCAAVINLAGEPVGDKRWTRAQKDRIRTSRVGVTDRIATIVRDAGIPVLINASAVGYYGPHGDEVIDESTGPGRGFRAEVCAQWEACARAAEASGGRVVLLRTGSVLAADGPLMARLLLFSRLFGRSIGDGAQWVPWVHIDDVIGMVMLALNSDTLRGPINITAPSPVRQRALSVAISRARGMPAFVRVPTPVMRLVFGEASTFILASQRAVPAVALRAGYDFRHPELEETVQDLIRGRR